MNGVDETIYHSSLAMPHSCQRTTLEIELLIAQMNDFGSLKGIEPQIICTEHRVM